MLFQPESGPHKRCFYKPIELQMSIHQRPRIYIYIFEATNPDVPWWYQLYTPQKDQDVVQRGTPKKIKTMSFWRNHGHMWYPKFGKHPCRCSILFPVSISPAQQIAAHRYSQYLCHQLRIGTRNQAKRNPYKVVPRKYKWRQMDVFSPPEYDRLIKGSWEAILPCYGQKELWDLTLMKGGDMVTKGSGDVGKWWL